MNSLVLHLFVTVFSGRRYDEKKPLNLYVGYVWKSNHLKLSSSSISVGTWLTRVERSVHFTTVMEAECSWET